MIECLRERSLVDFVYVSPQSYAGSPINSRDMPNTVEELEKMELRHCAGSTQTLLSKLSANTKKVCLVIVDYAALSTDADDIRTLVTYLKPFACRKALPHRSK
ncbi:hypothetical protein CU097_010506 [Rhizopus azygosporus]|uniref:Uncharacterized protein n=1 Tax=Rhizopus azygosporus TaxID=86630 RepID=A0A367JFU5_RHIAZ|nr:hypothetical protein CU097_010506 [Rhizopus azygosporus]